MFLKIIVGLVIVLLPAGVVLLLQRRLERRGPGIGKLADRELKRAFAHTLNWSMLAGVLFGFTIAWAAGAVLGGVPAMPTWMPPNAAFIPVFGGIVCVILASHPPMSGS